MRVIKNSKGFTLVELLAVIVILAVIILIAATNIGGLTTTARKNALVTEGNTMVESAKLAYNVKKERVDSIGIDTPVCFSLQYLYEDGYYSKSKTDGYQGSVLIELSLDGTQFTYTFYISNGSLKLVDQEVGGSKKEVEVTTDVASEICDNYGSISMSPSNGIAIYEDSSGNTPYAYYLFYRK